MKKEQGLQAQLKQAKKDKEKHEKHAAEMLDRLGKSTKLEDLFDDCRGDMLIAALGQATAAKKRMAHVTEMARRGQAFETKKRALRKELDELHVEHEQHVCAATNLEQILEANDKLRAVQNEGATKSDHGGSVTAVVETTAVAPGSTENQDRGNNESNGNGRVAQSGHDTIGPLYFNLSMQDEDDDEEEWFPTASPGSEIAGAPVCNELHEAEDEKICEGVGDTLQGLLARADVGWSDDASTFGGGDLGMVLLTSPAEVYVLGDAAVKKADAETALAAATGGDDVMALKAAIANAETAELNSQILQDAQEQLQIMEEKAWKKVEAEAASMDAMGNDDLEAFKHAAGSPEKQQPQAPATGRARWADMKDNEFEPKSEDNPMAESPGTAKDADGPAMHRKAKGKKLRKLWNTSQGNAQQTRVAGNATVQAVVSLTGVTC